MFNITLVTDLGNQKAFDKATDTFHPFPLDYNCSDFFIPGNSPPFNTSKFLSHENNIIQEFVNYKSKSNKLKELEKTKYDAGYSMGFNFDNIVIKRMNLAQLKWFMYMPEPLNTAVNHLPYDTSSDLPLYYPDRSALLN